MKTTRYFYRHKNYVRNTSPNFEQKLLSERRCIRQQLGHLQQLLAGEQDVIEILYSTVGDVEKPK